jgi:ketosteroid isomerase-like protein
MNSILPKLLSCAAIGLFMTNGQMPTAYAQAAAAKNDEAAVRQAGKDYLAAVERGDLKAVADLWAADGTYTDEFGHTSRVHDLLDHEAGGGKVVRPKTDVSDVKIRFLTPDVAVEEGNCETPSSTGASAIRGHYSALWIRQSGHWKLEDLRESRLDLSPDSGQLAELDIFAGQWSGEVNKLKIDVSANWNSAKTFLRRDFKVSSAGKEIFSGLQEIGWDPVSKHIRSWMFNDDGSYGDGLWSLEGNSWMVLTTRELPDGQTSKATHIYKFSNKNTMVWKSIRGSVGGQPADDFEIVLNRAAK